MLPYHDATAIGGISRDDDDSIHHDVRRYSNDREQQQQQHGMEEPETSKTRQCMKKTAKFLFSHIGLVGLVVVYAVAGAFLFELLEIHQDMLNCQDAQGEDMVEVNQLKQELVAYIQYNTTSSTTGNTYGKDNTTVAFAKIATMLYSYRDFILNISSTYRYTNDDCSVVNKWTFPNSLLFAITVITTIGYGNITPVTWEGQLCCVCYATIGIPIFLLCVANISGVLGEMFRFLYAKVLCKPCYAIKKRHERKKKLEEMNTERKTSGMNNNPGREWTLDDDDNNNNNNNIDSMKKRPLSAPNPEDNNIENDPQDRRVTVPLTITMLIIAAYIWFGSLIFHNFEEWTMIQAGYFCFITLSTIGFGDFVPGQRKDDANAGAKLIVGAIYVLFGMAILAMCFDLMQEEIVAKFRWIGRKIGIIDKEEEQQQVTDPAINNNDKRSSSAFSLNDRNQTSMTDRTVIDTDREDGLSSRRSTSATRKLSPRVNIARVHPLANVGTSEGNLHQRTTSTKFN